MRTVLDELQIECIMSEPTSNLWLMGLSCVIRRSRSRVEEELRKVGKGHRSSPQRKESAPVCLTRQRALEEVSIEGEDE